MSKQRRQLLIYSQSVILFCFIIYWLCTLLYAGPSNFLRIKGKDMVYIFDHLLYQKWSFFAPPPQSDMKIYYEFRRGKDQKIFDAVSFILQEKQRQAPFNQEAESLDYILFGSMINIKDMASEGITYAKVMTPSVSDSVQMKKVHDAINQRGLSLASYKTLINYGIEIAKRQSLINQYDSLRFFFTDVTMPKFKDRQALLNPDSLRKKQKEVVFFQSKFFPLASASK